MSIRPFTRALRRKNRENSAHVLKQEFRDNVERYRLVFKATSDVLYDLDLQTGSIDWNESLYKHYGYKHDKKMERLEWFISRIHPDDALRLETETSQWLEGKQKTSWVEYRFMKADGTYNYVRDRGVVQRNPDGSPIRIIGSLLDITEQTKLARAKDEFISLVSHQLRTPLTAIRVYSEMLTDGIYGEVAKGQVVPIHQITEASVRLIKLVDNILNISRIETGHVVSKPAPIDVQAFLRQSIEEVQPLADEKDVKITFKPQSKKLRAVQLDPTIFGQVVHNLLTNAVRYTRQGEGVIKVSFEKNSKGYLLSVEDNGIGIPEEAQSQIFNRFFRANNATDASENGTGLGLYLIKLMTESTNCKIWFHSIEDHGSTFYVQIPPEGMCGK